MALSIKTLLHLVELHFSIHIARALISGILLYADLRHRAHRITIFLRPVALALLQMRISLELLA